MVEVVQVVAAAAVDAPVRAHDEWISLFIKVFIISNQAGSTARNVSSICIKVAVKLCTEDTF